jgi:hypothetical protein
MLLKHRLLALAVLASVASCDRGDNPLSPSGDTSAAAAGDPIARRKPQNPRTSSWLP